MMRIQHFHEHGNSVALHNLDVVGSVALDRLRNPASQDAVVAGASFPGKGACHPHFGEFLQGAFEIRAEEGLRIERALVSTTVPGAAGAIAQFTLDLHRLGKFTAASGRHGIVITPTHYQKCAKAARLVLDEFGLAGVGGTLAVTTHVREGAGMGSSTAGVVATIRAVVEAISIYRGCRVLASPHFQARVAIAAEHACDSIMFESTASTVLFAHRKGTVLKTFNGPLPQMVILGFDTAPAGGVDTDRLPRARYSLPQLAAFRCAVAMLERAIEEQSVDLVGRVATFSALMSENAMANPLRKPKFSELLGIKAATGAAGVVVAHSGTVAGLIFDPAIPDCEFRIQQAEAAVDRLGFGDRRLFTTPY